MTSATLAYARSSGGRSRRPSFDPVLVLAVAGLLLIGFVMVTSASIAVAERQLGDPFFYLERQLIAAVIGLALAMTAMLIPISVWQRLAVPAMILAFVLLAAILIPGIGYEVNGSRRWLRLGLVNLQVSEVARVLLLMWLASYVVRYQAELKDRVQAFFKPLGVIVAAGALLLLEPDFGAATVLLITALAVLFLAGVKLRHFFVIAAAGAAALGLVAVTSAYRLKRLTSFMDPWADPFNSGFQLTQSLIAIGRGELFGVGLGASVQKLFYLPEAHTDFVFAVLAEEFGLLGILVMLALFLVVVFRSFQISRLAALAGMPYHAYSAAAFGAWLALQSFINVAVNMGLLPTKGLTLPLLSYGGSSLLVTLGWLGLVLRIAHEVQLSGRSAVARPARKSP